MENLIHDAWVLFVAMGSWMANQLTQKIDTVDKKFSKDSTANMDPTHFGISHSDRLARIGQINALQPHSLPLSINI